MNITTLNRLATAIIVVLVVIVGGVVVIIGDTNLRFDEYIRDVGIAVGLLAIGHGLDRDSTP